MKDFIITPAFLREQSARCVRLADSVNDRFTAEGLRKMGVKYQIRAERLEAKGDPAGV